VIAAGTTCARIRPLEGGPPDREPPRLLRVEPADSTTGLDRLPRFELVFSEKLAASKVRHAIRFVPPVRIADVRVRGARVTVTPAESLPPDTTVVLVVGTQIADRPPRDNRLAAEVALVYSTGPRLRAATALGRVTIKGKPDRRGAVAWEPVPADTSRAAARRARPVAACDAEGLFRLAGLPPDRPFLLRAFLDANENLRADDDEIATTLPETLQLALGEVRRGLAWNVIDPREPAQVSGVARAAEAALAAPVVVAFRRSDAEVRADSTLAAADTARADTLRPLRLPVSPRTASPWDAAYAALDPRGFVRREWIVVVASPRGDYSVRIPPGRRPLLAFVDVRRDSVPGLYVRPDSTGLDWEPLWVGDAVDLGPGAKVRLRSIEIGPGSR
jgi:hypothetical protein